MISNLKELEIFREATTVGIFIPSTNQDKIRKIFKKIIKEGKTTVFISLDNNGGYCFRRHTSNPFKVVTEEKTGITFISDRYPQTEIPDIVLIECSSQDSSPYDNLALDRIHKPIIGILNQFSPKVSYKTNVHFILNKKLE